MKSEVKSILDLSTDSYVADIHIRLNFSELEFIWEALREFQAKACLDDNTEVYRIAELAELFTSLTRLRVDAENFGIEIDHEKEEQDRKTQILNWTQNLESVGLRSLASEIEFLDDESIAILYDTIDIRR